LAKGEALCREALTHVESLDDSGPEMHRAKKLAKVNVALATKLNHMERTTDAEVALRRAIAAYEDLLKGVSSDTDLRVQTASANNSLAKILRNQGRLAEEEAFFTRAAQLQQELVKDFPDRTQYRHFLVWLYGTRGEYFEKNRMWSQACDMLQQRLPHQLQLFRILPVSGALRRYRNSYYSYANILYELERLEESREAFRETLRAARKLVKEKVEVEDSAEWLAIIHSTCPFPEICDHEESMRALPPSYLDPDTDAAPFNDEHIILGMTYYRGGELQKALATLRGESTPAKVNYNLFQEVDRVLWRCRILLDLGETEQARRDFGKAQIDAANLPPRDDDAMAFLARKRLIEECSEILQSHQPPAEEAEASHAESTD
jgi:tetratricopeptide (TPR) repeat protein